MKPLVYYARWEGVKLRMRGRSETAVWGQLIYTDTDGNEQPKLFHFDLNSWQITIGEGDDKQIIQLDEMGTVPKEVD